MIVAQVFDWLRDTAASHRLQMRMSLKNEMQRDIKVVKTTTALQLYLILIKHGFPHRSDGTNPFINFSGLSATEKILRYLLRTRGVLILNSKSRNWIICPELIFIIDLLKTYWFQHVLFLWNRI